MNSVTYLQSLGCCSRCVLLYNGIREPENHATAAAVIAATQALLTQGYGSLDPSTGNTHSTVGDKQKNACGNDTASGNIAGQTESVEKREPSIGPVVDGASAEMDVDDEEDQATAVCVSCLGLLQDTCCSEDIVRELCLPTQHADYDATSFSLSVSLPVCVTVRTHVIGALHAARYSQGVGKEHRSSLTASIKDAWKSAVCHVFATTLGKTYTSGEAVLSVTLTAHYGSDSAECNTAMTNVGHTGAAAKRPRSRNYWRYKYNKGGNNNNNKEEEQRDSCLNGSKALPGYSRQTVESVLSCMKDEQLLQRLGQPGQPSSAVTLTPNTPSRSSIFVAGRYCKFSRELSQTPWMIQGELKCSNSVEQLIAGAIMERTRAHELKFLSSGREDVDVRCLGEGRPFALELLDPHRAELGVQELQRLQLTINANTHDISVSHLQLVTREETSVLRFNTEDKVKNYCALCVVRDGNAQGVTETQLQTLQGLSPLTIQQQTPLRVLHRRPLLTRPRTLYRIQATSVNQHFFKLSLRTEAGTYIKELVHGDFGRTQPSISSILGRQVDIIALDVTNVELDWPAAIMDQ